MSETAAPSVIESAEPPVPPTAVDNPGPVGVGGWLLFLCIWLTVVVPLVNVGLVGLDLSATLPNASRVPGLMALSVINAVMVLALIGFSIFAGVSLWRRRDPGAVKILRVYLFCFLGSKLIATVLPFVVGMNRELAQEIALSVGGGTSSAVVFAMGVLLYTQRSKRVRATYGLPEPESA